MASNLQSLARLTLDDAAQGASPPPCRAEKGRGLLSDEGPIYNVLMIFTLEPRLSNM